MALVAVAAGILHEKALFVAFQLAQVSVAGCYTAMMPFARAFAGHDRRAADRADTAAGQTLFDLRYVPQEAVLFGVRNFNCAGLFCAGFVHLTKTGADSFDLSHVH